VLLAPFQPWVVLPLALAGAPLGLRRPWRETWPTGLLAAAVLGPVLDSRMWWGGQCPPGRFLVPVGASPRGFVALRAAREGAAPPRGILRWRRLSCRTEVVQPPARFERRPRARSSTSTRSRWSPCSSRRPSLNVPPAPQAALRTRARANLSASGPGRPETTVTTRPDARRSRRSRIPGEAGDSRTRAPPGASVVAVSPPVDQARRVFDEPDPDGRVLLFLTPRFVPPRSSRRR
jgi:hypothetical protein